MRITGHVIKHFKKLEGFSERFDKIDANSVLSQQTYTGRTIMPPKQLPKSGPVPNTGCTIHRARLAQVLSEYARDLGIEFLMNTKVIEFYEDEERAKGGCFTKDGQRFEADIVIAADGIGSRSSRLVSKCKTLSDTKSSGYAIYRGTYPAAIARRDPNVADRFPPLEDGKSHMQLWIGPNCYAMIFVTDEIANWQFMHQDRSGASESWNYRTSLSNVMDSLEENPDWHPAVKAMIRNTPPEEVYDWRCKLYFPHLFSFYLEWFVGRANFRNK